MSDLFMSGGVQHAPRRWHRSTAPGSAASGTGSSCGSDHTPARSCATWSTMDDDGDDAGSGSGVGVNGGFDGDFHGGGGRDFENLLSLQLRKPKHWKWELTTSRSCTNIALPRILLYNHKGELLVDAPGEREQCIREADVTTPVARRSRSDTRSGEKSPTRDAGGGGMSSPSPSPLLLSFTQRRPGRAATANLEHSIRRALDRQLSGLQIQEATPTPSPSPTSVRSVPLMPRTLHSPIDLYTNELPDGALGRRSSSLKGVRFRGLTNGGGENDGRRPKGLPHTLANGYALADLPTPPSTVTPTPTASSSSGAREKRRYRRSHSSGRSPANSRSILERMSYSRGRYSSPETELAETQQLAQAPRYFLRSSKAGTLMLREESFTQQRRRRRKPKTTSSSENLPGERKSRSRSSSLLRLPDDAPPPPHGREGGSLQDISELPERRRGKAAPIRRFRSDGNVLLLPRNDAPTPSCSDAEEEEEAEVEDDAHPYYNNNNNNTVFRTASKKRDALPAIDSGNEIASGWSRPTRR